jgi:hypothetical protein
LDAAPLAQARYSSLLWVCRQGRSAAGELPGDSLHQVRVCGHMMLLCSQKPFCVHTCVFLAAELSCGVQIAFDTHRTCTAVSWHTGAVVRMQQPVLAAASNAT